MANFPTSLDALATNQPWSDGTTVITAALLNAIQGAVDAVQTKVGVNNSVVAASVDYKLTNKVKRYESGWFAVEANTAYTKPHGLAVRPDVVQILVSNTSDGTGEVTTGGWNASDRFVNLADLNSTNVVVRTGPYGVARLRDAAGNDDSWASGYCNIIAVKFN